MIPLFNMYILPKLSNKKGQGMVEYALLIGLVAIVVIGTLILLGPAIGVKFQEIITKLAPVPAA